MTPQIQYIRDGEIPKRASVTRYAAVLRGEAPAEALATSHRERLVTHLVTKVGMSDQAIADLTRMTTYTTARIRNRLGLPANPNGQRRSPNAA
jgi:hypothetical protein